MNRVFGLVLGTKKGDQEKANKKTSNTCFTETVAEHYFVGTQIHIKETLLNWFSWRNLPKTVALLSEQRELRQQKVN